MRWRGHRLDMMESGSNFGEIGTRIRDLRVALGYDSASVFAGHVGWSPQQLSNYEKGKKRPEISMAIKLCVRTGATLDYIYRGECAGLPLRLANRIQDYLERKQTASEQAE
jgi:transcriptional regulator with XRE-family HTH domain